jgi:hypothetical protein
MKRIALLGLALSSLSLVAPGSAHAQATRTWVSGVGDDANPCSRIAPCKTFAGAISKTAPGGEIDALDPGGFGAVTITKSITIDGGGQLASVLVAGTNGIIINAGPADTVTLRNIQVNGVKGTSVPGLNGIRFLSGAALHIENCTIFGFSQNGVDVNLNTASAARVSVTDTVLSNNAGGLVARNAGAGTVFVTLQRTTFAQNNNVGLEVDGNGAAIVRSFVSDSMFTDNGTALLAQGGGAGAAIQVNRSSVLSSVTTGAVSNGPTAFILISNTLIAGNAVALSATGSGHLQTYQNNSLGGNISSDGSFTETLPSR